MVVACAWCGGSVAVKKPAQHAIICSLETVLTHSLCVITTIRVVLINNGFIYLTYSYFSRKKSILFYFNILKCANPAVLVNLQCPTTQVSKTNILLMLLLLL